MVSDFASLVHRIVVRLSLQRAWELQHAKDIELIIVTAVSCWNVSLILKRLIIQNIKGR